MDFFAAGEVDTIDLADHIMQQIAAVHAVVDAPKDGSDHVLLTAATFEAAQVSEQPRAARAVGQRGVIVVDEGFQLIASHARIGGGPIAPTVGRLDDRDIGQRIEHRFFFAAAFEVIEEFEKHDPGEHRQTVKVTVQPFVFAHDVPRGLDDGG